LGRHFLFGLRTGSWQEQGCLYMPPAVILILISSQSGLQYFRYFLPIFPFVIVGTGVLVKWVGRSEVWRLLVITLLVIWLITSSVGVWPDELAYFNEIAGGPQRGYLYLLDSNIDWGQGLLFLKQWLEEHREARPLQLAYYNTVDPTIIGIKFSLPPPGANRLFNDDIYHAANHGPLPGYYAVSVNYVCGMPGVAADGRGGYRQITRDEYRYFEYFQPIAKAGWSIFIYHITLDEANAVRKKLSVPAIVATDTEGA
jgi:hypothetical protein